MRWRLFNDRPSDDEPGFVAGGRGGACGRRDQQGGFRYLLEHFRIANSIRYAGPDVVRHRIVLRCPQTLT